MIDLIKGPKIPKKEELCKLLDDHDKSSWGKHEWKKSRIQWHSFTRGHHHYVGKRSVASINTMRVCAKCGSKKFIRAHYTSYAIKPFLHWDLDIYHAKIEYSENYHDSSCWKRYYRKRMNRFLAKPIFRCPKNCGFQTFDKEILDGHMKQHERAERHKHYLQLQIERNGKIIEQLKTKRKKKPLEKLRLSLAIYRLYKYCDLTPKKIAEEFNLPLYRTKSIIGETFRIICLSSQSCVFREHFLQN